MTLFFFLFVSEAQHFQGITFYVVHQVLNYSKTVHVLYYFSATSPNIRQGYALGPRTNTSSLLIGYLKWDPSGHFLH